MFTLTMTSEVMCSVLCHFISAISSGYGNLDQSFVCKALIWLSYDILKFFQQFYMLISELLSIISAVFGVNSGNGVAVAKRLVAIKAMAKQEEEGTER